MLVRPTYCRLNFWAITLDNKLAKNEKKVSAHSLLFFFLLPWTVPNCKNLISLGFSTATTPRWPHLLADWVKPGVRATCLFVSHLWSQIVSSMPISGGVAPDLEPAPTPCRQRHTSHALDGAAAVLHITHLSRFASARRTSICLGSGADPRQNHEGEAGLRMSWC